jgi:hypothetical protein
MHDVAFADAHDVPSKLWMLQHVYLNSLRSAVQKKKQTAEAKQKAMALFGEKLAEVAKFLEFLIEDAEKKVRLVLFGVVGLVLVLVLPLFDPTFSYSLSATLPGKLIDPFPVIRSGIPSLVL